MLSEGRSKKFGRLYLESFKQEVVREAELEGSLAFVCQRHGISETTLQRWMSKYGSIAYQQGKSRRRSLSEREGIAREIVSGHISVEEAMLKYNAPERDTINQWIRQYKQRQQELIVLPEAISSIAPESEPDAASSADLKAAELKIRALEIMLDIASKEFKVDIRKKFGAKL